MPLVSNPVGGAATLDELKLIAHHAKDDAAKFLKRPAVDKLRKLARSAMQHLGMTADIKRPGAINEVVGVYIREFAQAHGRGSRSNPYPYVSQHLSTPGETWTLYKLVNSHWSVVRRGADLDYANAWVQATVRGGERRKIELEKKRPAKKRNAAPRSLPGSPRLAKWVKAVLANDEGSTDAELVAYFVSEGPMSKAEAQKWVAQRAKLSELPARSRKNRRNPAGAAAAKFEKFHGRPASRETTITTERHEHEYVAEIGKLIRLVVVADDDSEIELKGFRGSLLTMDEAGTQLFIDGGDQSVDLAAFGFRKPFKELLVLGLVSEVTYFTTKDHLGADGGTARYVHKFGEDGGELPTLVYRPRDESLEFAGGGYTLPAEGIRD